MWRLTGITLIVVLCGCVSEMRTSSLPPAATPLSEWSVPGHRAGENLYVEDLVIGYANGFLVANRVSDGTEAWRRHPDNPVLGVIYKTQEETTGFPIAVVPGSSAAAAGMATDDVLLSFNGHETLNFMRDLRQAVIAMKPGDPFTATVRRAGHTLSLMGIMGGEPVEPAQANRTSVVVRPQGKIWRPGPMVRYSVHDVHSGKRILEYHPWDRNDGKPGMGLLTPHDILIVIETGGLVGLPVRGNLDNEQVHPLWPLPLPIGESDETEKMHLLSDELLWMSDSMAHHVAIVDVASGHVRVVLPEDPTSTPLLAGPFVLSLRNDGIITCYDIATGKQAWQSAKGYNDLLAAHGDYVFACDRDNHLVILDTASGTMHRKFGEWIVNDDSLFNQDRLGLHVSTPSHAQILVSIATSNGEVQWQHELPMGANVVNLVFPPDGFGCVLGDENARTLLMMSSDGKIRQNCWLKADEVVIPTPGRAIASGPHGLRVLPMGSADAPSP